MSETDANAEAGRGNPPPDDRPERPGVGPLVDRLRVRRNGIAGAAVGALVAALLYAVRVFELLGPFAGRQTFPVVGPEGWFLLLALVFASSTAVIVATLLTLATGYAVVREETRGEAGEPSQPRESDEPR